MNDFIQITNDIYICVCLHTHTHTHTHTYIYIYKHGGGHGINKGNFNEGVGYTKHCLQLHLFQVNQK